MEVYNGQSYQHGFTDYLGVPHFRKPAYFCLKGMSGVLYIYIYYTCYIIYMGY